MRVQGDPDSTKNGVFYLHSDHLGSTSLTTCGNSGGCGGVPNGGVVARQLYDAWGNVRSGGGLPTDIAFTGQRSDTGLMYFKARYYDGAVGRFVSADTIVPDGHNPQQFNRYAYGLNNPVKYTDPSGHCVPGEDGCHTGDLEAPLTQQINQTAMSWERTPYFALSPADPTTFTGNAENGFGNTTFAFNHQGLYGGLGHLHSGIDIGMPAGTRLQAMDYGVVLCRNCMIGQGETSVAIRYGRYAVVYGHATIAEGLDDGDVVLPGTYVGDSGIGNNYAHLHLEMRDMTVGNAASPDEFVNPLYFFSSNVVNAMNIQWQDFANPSTGAADPDYGPKSMISYNRRTSDNQLGNFWQGNLSSVSWAPRPDLDRRYGP
jgi:RHS repeat-associated protein